MPVAFPCLNTVKRVELFVVRYSLDSLEERRPTLTPSEYATSKAALEEALDAREFAAEGRLWNAVMGKFSGLFGVAVSLWACVAEGCEAAKPPIACPLTPDDALADLRSNEAEVSAAATLVVPDFFALAGARAGRPPAEVQKARERMAKTMREEEAKAKG